jgi:integrase/recombinase XerD
VHRRHPVRAHRVAAGVEESEVVTKLVDKPISTARLKSSEQLGPEHVRTFLLYLLNERKLAWGTIQGARPALKFLYMRTLKPTWIDQEIIKHKVRRKLHTIRCREEVCALLDAPMNTKQCTADSVRQRTASFQEALDLKVTDIDSKRMIIYIRKGKGKFPCPVMLSPKMLECGSALATDRTKA